MLAASFFVVIFSSLVWLIYAIRFINDSLAGISFFDAGIANILLYVLLLCAPIFLIWSVFGYANQYINNRNVNLQLRKLLSQMKKNQDYSDLLARVLIESEAHIRDGFVLSKFDLLIADMNELLSEIIRNCKIASAEQIENLWNRVQNGGKWAFGKVLIEVNNSQPNFKKKVFEKAAFDNILAGTILEFCARYQSVVKMLEKHDNDKVFLTMIENGIMGKVFSILAPVADELRRGREAALSLAEDISEQEELRPIKKPLKNKISHPIKQPLDTLWNRSNNEEDTTEKKSFFSKIVSIRRPKNSVLAKSFPKIEKDPFSIALEKSFGEEETILPQEPHISLPDESDIKDVMSLSALQKETAEDDVALVEDNKPMITDTQKTLDNLKKEWAEMETSETSPIVSQTENNDDKEDEDIFTYPFGNWTDEKNYQKRS
ncbi:MAG: hypothetical protein E7010_01825 [Alphaproteobacteria bacterium]|nr:hypothetical protein [Alphaproteobacteria bacterium]